MFPLAQILTWVAQAIPERVAVSQAGKGLTYGELLARSGSVARALAARGLGARLERSALQPWQSGQSHVALYLQNCPEYLELMLGCFMARAVPFNVNYRYVHDELAYLFADAATEAIVYHRRYGPEVATLAAGLPDALLIEVDDGSHPGEPVPLIPGAALYEVLAGEELGRDGSAPLPVADADDLYLLYTGGTTGMPKGVLWRQGDILLSVLGGTDERTGRPLRGGDEFVARARKNRSSVLIAPPFMHAAGQWVAFNALVTGSTVVLPDRVDVLDAPDIWRTAERERVARVMIVGDAFAVPLIDALNSGSYDLQSLRFIHSTGAALQPGLKDAFCELIEGVAILDTVGSSEGGRQGQTVSAGAAERGAVRYRPQANAVVVSADQTRLLEPGEDELGWWAAREPIPLGYLGDQKKTERTFITIAGQRLSLPGDRARLGADGSIELHGRDSVTINSGGEKIFAEEVEAALREHPAVYDVVVVGRPSERWGSEVVAVVALRANASASLADLQEVAGRHLARYKLPKDCIFCDEVRRGPSGKADYRWARLVVEEAAGT